MEERNPVDVGVPLNPRLHERTPLWELRRASEESQLLFMTDGQFIYVYLDGETINRNDIFCIERTEDGKIHVPK